MDSTRITPKDWQELAQLTQGHRVLVERVRIAEKDVAIEGSFELPQLARISMDDQIFITAFVRSHGSIKEMERIFGVSYPTIKSRLTRIANSLEFVETNPTSSKSEILERLQRGEITAEDAIREMEALQ
ncbi:MAG: RNA polymerase subunit sigma-70 [Acidobacteria bacterium]|nr:MAG: RNA polymerase subunit sigma-70 [Acidobacteriota bacterium]